MLQVIIVYQLGGFLLREQFLSLGNSDLAGARLLATHVLKHPLQLTGHLFHSRRAHNFYADRWAAYFNFYLFVVQFPFPE